MRPKAASNPSRPWKAYLGEISAVSQFSPGFPGTSSLPNSEARAFWYFYALCLGRNSKKPSPNLPIKINWVNESQTVTILISRCAPIRAPRRALPKSATQGRQQYLTTLEARQSRELNSTTVSAPGASLTQL